MQLWYDLPAGYWEEALPIGNGRIGAMVWSGVNREKISLNEDSLWSGYPADHNIQGAAPYYREVRQLALDGRYQEAEVCVAEHLLGKFTQSYLPLGDLLLDMHQHEGEAEQYCRTLSLNEACSTLGYTLNGVSYTREAFVSAPDQLFVMQLSADQPGQISFTASFASQLKTEVSVQDGRMILDGLAPSQVDPSYVQSEHPVIYEEAPEKKGMRFRAIATFELDGGSIVMNESEIEVKAANRVVIRIAAQTSFNGPFRQPFLDGKPYAELCQKDLEAKGSYSELKARHIADYQQYFNRVTLDVGKGMTHLPIPERLKNWEKDGDPELYALLFQFGRYLIISASRPGTQPTNLQGIWNQHLRAPWSSNFTININTEMNYWPVEAVGLPEFHEPLFDLMNTLRRTGEKTARVYYDANGFVAHHNTDIWGLSNPVGDNNKDLAVCSFWPMSAGWLSAHAYEHYLFGRDQSFLRETGYPIIRDAARFYLDVLTEDADGTLIFAPSSSPENRYVKDGFHGGIAKTATMTTAIIRETLSNAVSCCKILDIDADFCKEAEQALTRLPEYQIGSRGELLEWSEELEESEPLHRHNSHLYPLYPGHEITPEKTPDLAAACRRTLELRGDESTGWALAWRINLWARLHDGERAYKVMQKQLRPIDGNITDYSGGGGCYPNMFGGHPPFQIDSNYGVCAGMAELLLQSDVHTLELLPALPKAFATGSVKGLRARGGIDTDISFKDGRLQTAELSLKAGETYAVTVHYAGKTHEITLRAGEKVTLTAADF